MKIGRQRKRATDPNDKRPPMHRFLAESAQSQGPAPMYHQQWQTLWKAERLGYITGYGGTLTIKGKAELNRLNKNFRVVPK